MKKFMKKYGFITLMLLGIVAGCIVGAAWPGATALKPFGTLFINMMFCVVVPMVFCSIASAIANMSSAKRAGRIMGITVGTFLSTAAIAAILMYVIVRFVPVFTAAPSYEESGVGTVDIGTLIINFFTKPDFTELWSRRAILILYNGHVYAASMNGMPHGTSTINNDFSGHFCIHFLNSRTHETDRVDPDHQSAVQTASRATW